MKENKLYFIKQRLEKLKRAYRISEIITLTPTNRPLSTASPGRGENGHLGFHVNANHVLVLRRKILPDSTWERKPPPPHTHTHTYTSNSSTPWHSVWVSTRSCQTGIARSSFEQNNNKDATSFVQNSGFMQ